MKCMIVLSCVLVAVYGGNEKFRDDLMSKMGEFADTCFTESGASDADVGELMDKKIPSSKEGKCLLACFQKKLGAMKDGKFDKDGMKGMFESIKSENAELYGKLVKLVDTCVDEVEKVQTDECEKAAKMMDCSNKVAGEMEINIDEMME